MLGCLARFLRFRGLFWCLASREAFWQHHPKFTAIFPSTFGPPPQQAWTQCRRRRVCYRRRGVPRGSSAVSPVAVWQRRVDSGQDIAFLVWIRNVVATYLLKYYNSANYDAYQQCVSVWEEKGVSCVYTSRGAFSVRHACICTARSAYETTVDRLFGPCDMVGEAERSKKTSRAASSFFRR